MLPEEGVSTVSVLLSSPGTTFDETTSNPAGNPADTATRQYLVYAADDASVKRAELNGTDQQTILSSGCRSLAIDYKNQRLFCVALRAELMIQVIDLQQNTSNRSETLVNSSETHVDSIAFDWVHSNIYWTQPSQVVVLSTETKYKKAIITGKTGRLGAIVVDPRDHQGWLYYVGDDDQIWKAGLDGSEDHLFVPESAGVARHALTIGTHLILLKLFIFFAHVSLKLPTKILTRAS